MRFARALIFASMVLFVCLFVPPVMAHEYSETVEVYEYSIGGVIRWTHHYDGSADPIGIATLTIVADDVDGPGAGMDGEQDLVFWDVHHLGLLNDMGYYTNWNYFPGPGNPDQPLTTTTFDLDPAWITVNGETVTVEVETDWGVEIETSTLTIISASQVPEFEWSLLVVVSIAAAALFIGKKRWTQTR